MNSKCKNQLKVAWTHNSENPRAGVAINLQLEVWIYSLAYDF